MDRKVDYTQTYTDRLLGIDYHTIDIANVRFTDPNPKANHSGGEAHVPLKDNKGFRTIVDEEDLRNFKVIFHAFKIYCAEGTAPAERGKAKKLLWLNEKRPEIVLNAAYAPCLN